MGSGNGVGLADVMAVYDGPEGALWELIMGAQIHIGGFKSSMDLAEKAGIAEGTKGVDLCCCNGAGMRFLVRYRGVAGMTGVDATKTVVESGRARSEAEGSGDKIRFVQADVCESGLADASADFVWAEDAWCYVVDKPKLVAEASRIVKPGGLIAYTDWVEGPKGLSDDEAKRLFAFMKFPNIQSIVGYKTLLERSGCEIVHAADTGRFAPYIDLYLQMVDMQLTSDVLRIIDYNMEMLQGIAGEMVFMQTLAHDRKIAQGLFVAKKNG
jgi:ubiquinone/menaquinone biosynthesis C-methylase UbiE